MVNVLKQELSPFPQSLAKPGGEMNTISKVDLISSLISRLHTPSDVPDADVKIFVLIVRHALIPSHGNHIGCHTFGGPAGVFIQISKLYFWRTYNQS